MTTIVPIKCALRYKPPVLILVYKDEKTGKLRRRSMPLRGFTASTDTSTYMNGLKANRNKHYFNAIPETQLLSLLNKIKHAHEQALPSPAPEKIALSSLHNLPPLPATSTHSPLCIDTNNTEELLLMKSRTSTVDERFNHALNELLEDSDSALEGHSFANQDLLRKKPVELWDEPSGDNEVPDYSPDFNSESEIIGKKEDNADSFPAEEVGDEENSLDLSRELLNDCHLKDEDLNLLSEDQLKAKKAEMDVLFEANRLKPGDDGYEYDKEVDFSGPKMESGWDSENSSFMEF